jgi:hypothetical protein
MEYDKNRNVYRRFIDGLLSRLFFIFLKRFTMWDVLIENAVEGRGVSVE